jgi:hypothetical protein
MPKAVDGKMESGMIKNDPANYMTRAQLIGRRTTGAAAGPERPDLWRQAVMTHTNWCSRGFHDMRPVYAEYERLLAEAKA